MIEDDVKNAYAKLAAWCRREGYTGYDPFDGLNSRLFQLTPVKDSRLARLIWLQTFKRLPFNLRKLVGISPGKNSKGIALFALARLAEFRSTGSPEVEREVRGLLDTLESMQLKGWSGAAWGYNFDWQARAFFVPSGTPTIVPTAFVARALIEAAELFDSDKYLKLARSACDLILHDLNRTEDTNNGLCFSYTPLDQTRIFNASLLAAETLASVGKLTREQELLDIAIRAAKFVIHHQRADGSWPYGTNSYHSWCDNFHTAFMLLSLYRIMMAGNVSDKDFSDSIRRGYEFWYRSFFLKGGLPKYYHNQIYPVDAHSAGAAIVTLLEIEPIVGDTAHELANRVAHWSIQNLQDRDGYFYYQKRRFFKIKIPYMRWTQGWMLYGLARLIEAESV
jgi:hypothetical protein